MPTRYGRLLSLETKCVNVFIELLDPLQDTRVLTPGACDVSREFQSQSALITR